MALPFDVRMYASASAADGPEPYLQGVSSETSPRTSRALVIPPALVAGIQARDVDALRALVRLAYVPLVRFAQSIVRSRDDAEDVVQDVFTALWDRGTQWNPGVNVAAYLFTSVRNQALKEIRRRTRAERRAARAHTEWRSANAEHASASILDHVVATESHDAQRRAVAEVLETCSERQRTAYDLRYHRGLTIPAIAEVLGITVKSAEQLVRRVTHLVLARLADRV